MGPQNRAIGNTAFQTVGFGESAYGRVAYGPAVSIPGLISPNGTTIAGGPSGGTTIQWDLNQGNEGSPLPTSSNAPLTLDSEYANQLARLNADNTELYRQLAAAQQQLKTTQDSNIALEQQLSTQRTQSAQFQRLNEESQQRLQIMQSSGTTNSGFQGAVLRGNNSLTQNMNRLQVPGVEVAADGDVIRVTIPSDALFQPGTYDLQPNAGPMLNQLAANIRQFYTGQIVGIEAHWDPNSLASSPVNAHQLTADQALALLKYLTMNQQLPAQQLLVMGYGSNRQRFSNATPQGQAANRRIELVVYPDRF
jgi:flagellar motor protein MotB